MTVLELRLALCDHDNNAQIRVRDDGITIMNSAEGAENGFINCPFHMSPPETESDPID